MMPQSTEYHPIIGALRQRASALGKTVAMPETEDSRTFYAVAMALDAGICRVVLVGAPARITPRLESLGIDLSAVEIVDPADESVLRQCAQVYIQARQRENLSEQQARRIVANPLRCATCLLKMGKVDACVAGAAHPTAEVLRALLHIVGCAPGVHTVSSCLIMTMPDSRVGHKGALVFADCGVVPQPSAEQLADIAISTAVSARLYLQTEPRVAMLSFSTKGSADHADVKKVVEATNIARSKIGNLIIDGELQADAALMPEIAQFKDPNGLLGGRANVLIFPDLDAGNMAYKLVQRLARARAYGPLVQGLAKAGMDLSRGASAEEIVNVMAIAAVRAEALEEDGPGSFNRA